MQEETMKCYNPNKELAMCRECKRGVVSKNNEYESFNLHKTLMNGWKCDGYVSKRESGSLFDEQDTKRQTDSHTNQVR